MTLLGVNSIIEAYDNGYVKRAEFRKSSTAATGVGFWFDLSMTSGNPAPNYYASAPNESKVMAYSTDAGIYHGNAVSPQKKYLKRIMYHNVGAGPSTLLLCDYLMYYPFVDMSITGDQDMIQTDTLTRYTDGAGVRMMVILQASQVGGSQLNITYTNQDGVSGRVTPTVTCNSSSLNGTAITHNRVLAGSGGLFMPLQTGDSGVRSVEKVNFVVGDVGLVAIVLVKPLATCWTLETTAPGEVDFVRNKLSCPVIEDDAYLHFMAIGPQSFINFPFVGELEFFWS